MSNYKLEHIGCNTWRCSDQDTGAYVEFLEAQFSSPDYYNVPLPPEVDASDPEEISRYETKVIGMMRGWLNLNHRDIAYTNDCNARCTAIYKMGGQYQWMTIINAIKTVVINNEFKDKTRIEKPKVFDITNRRIFLDKVVNEYNDLIIRGKVKDDLPDWQRFNLLGSIALFTEKEAEEVLRMVGSALDSAAVPVYDWINDIYRWPYQYQASWLPF